MIEPVKVPSPVQSLMQSIRAKAGSFGPGGAARGTPRGMLEKLPIHPRPYTEAVAGQRGIRGPQAEALLLATHEKGAITRPSAGSVKTGEPNGKGGRIDLKA